MRRFSNFLGQVANMLFSSLGLLVITISLAGCPVAVAQFFPNYFQGSNPGSQGVPGLFPVLGGTDNKNNGHNVGGGWPFFGGLVSPQQQGGYNQNPLRQGQDQQQVQQSPYANPFYGGFPGFANPWYNPNQQQQQVPPQSQTPSSPYQPQQQTPSQGQYPPYQPQQQQPQQYQNPAYPDPTREQQPSKISPSNYPSPGQPPVPPPTYQNPQPQQAGYPTNSQWSPQPAPRPAPTAGQPPPKLDDGQYRPGIPPNNEYAQSQPTLNVNGEPYAQQQQQQEQPLSTGGEGELVGDLRSNPKNEGGSSQQLLPAIGSAPGQGWVYPDDA